MRQEGGGGPFLLGKGLEKEGGRVQVWSLAARECRRGCRGKVGEEGKKERGVGM